MSDEIGTRLSAARQDLGLSQEFVAQRIGVPRSALSDIERNRRRVSTDEAVALANLYGCSVERLVTGASSTDTKVNALARVTDGLTDDDVAEVARFAEFLRTRTKHRSSD